MKISDTFLVPSYYTDFHCKGGSCRHTCCQDLVINITMEEYYHLAGIDCSPDLRRRLDTALHLLSHPSAERYACISPDFTGRCRMLSENGLCALQMEKGFGALTSVCKYFPRSMKFENSVQCSTSNACEATLELFLDPTLPSSFVKIPLDFDLWALPEEDRSEMAKAKAAAHLFLVKGFLDFSAPLGSRISWLDECCAALESLSTPEEILKKLQSLPDSCSSQNRFFLSLTLQDSITHRKLFSWYRDHYDTMAPFCSKVLEHLDQADDAYFRRHIRNLQKLHPILPTFINRALANDLFYRGFPYTDPRLSLSEEAHAFLYTVSSFLLLFLSMDESSSDENMIDMSAAYFRMVELTGFSHAVLSVISQ